MPSHRAWRFCIDSVRPGDHAESLRFTQEKRVSIKARRGRAARKRSAHLGVHAADAPGFRPALGRNHALRAESHPDVAVIPLAAELGVGPHQADPCLDVHLHPQRQKSSLASAVKVGRNAFNSGLKKLRHCDLFSQGMPNCGQEFTVIRRLLEVGDCPSPQRTLFIVNRISGTENDDGS